MRQRKAEERCKEGWVCETEREKGRATKNNEKSEPPRYSSSPTKEPVHLQPPSQNHCSCGCSEIVAVCVSAQVCIQVWVCVGVCVCSEPVWWELRFGNPEV